MGKRIKEKKKKNDESCNFKKVEEIFKVRYGGLLLHVGHNFDKENFCSQLNMFLVVVRRCELVLGRVVEIVGVVALVGVVGVVVVVALVGVVALVVVAVVVGTVVDGAVVDGAVVVVVEEWADIVDDIDFVAAAAADDGIDVDIDSHVEVECADFVGYKGVFGHFVVDYVVGKAYGDGGDDEDDDDVEDDAVVVVVVVFVAAARAVVVGDIAVVVVIAADVIDAVVVNRAVVVDRAQVVLVDELGEIANYPRCYLHKTVQLENVVLVDLPPVDVG